MKKKWVTVIIGLIFIVALIGAGGKMFIDKRAEQKEAEKIEAERMSVEALKNTFKDIKSVEFEKSGYNEMTGSYAMIVKMKNMKDHTAKFDFSYTEGIEKITSYKIVDEQGVQQEGDTTDVVKIVYSNGEKGEE